MKSFLTSLPTIDPSKGLSVRLQSPLKGTKWQWGCSILSLLAIILMSSCEQIIELNQGKYEPKLVVYGAIRIDSVPVIHITESQDLSGWLEQLQETQFVEGLSPLISADNDSWLLKEGTFYEKF